MVTGIWFCSLFFSLLGALGASLVTSWVAKYAQVELKDEIKANAKDAYHRHLRFLRMIRLAHGRFYCITSDTSPYLILSLPLVSLSCYWESISPSDLTF